ncbi:MAG: helix-turn-helix transcriptional regulator [Polyangiaceae bacterium]
MRSHVHERLSVERIARRVAMSPSHFAHRFRDILRVSPMQFVRHLRMQKARELLIVDGRAAAEVAEEVGYASPSHFSRDFKSAFGAPPRAYVQRFVS